MKPFLIILTTIVIGVLLTTCARKNVFDEPPDHPVIDSISPASGIRGTQVRLYGSGFSTSTSDNTVKINGKTIRVDSPSTARVILVTVTDSTGTGPVHINVNDKEADGPVFTYLVDVNAPIITSLTPSAGWIDTAVNIKGQNFGTIPADITVKFNGHPAQVTKVTDTLLVALAPIAATNGAPGNAIVTVTVKDKTSNGVNFTYGQTQTSVITKAAAGWADGSGYSLNVTNLPLVDSTIHLFVFNTEIPIDAVTRVGHQFYDPAEGEQLLVRYNDTVENHVPVNIANFKVVIRGQATNIYPLQVKPKVDSIKSKYGDYVYVAGDTVTVYGRFFGDGSPTSEVVMARYTGAPTPVTISWSNKQIKARVPDLGLRPGITAPMSVKVNDLESYSYYGSYYGPVRATMTLVAGTDQGYQDGPVATAKFNSPYGITRDVSGNLYVSEENGHRIRKITPAGIVSTWAGSSVAGFKDADGNQAQFNRPQGLDITPGGDILVADASNFRIRAISPGQSVTTVAGGQVSDFWYPTGVFYTANGILVADMNNNRIRKILPGGSIINVAGGPAGQPGSFADGPAANARFNNPYSVIQVGSNFYVADGGNRRIRKIAPDGTVSTFAGSGVNGFADGNGTAAQFETPNCLTADAQGNIYVIDFFNSGYVRKIDPNGGVTTIIAEFADGSGIAASLGPTGIISDGNKTLWIADYGLHRIYKMVLK